LGLKIYFSCSITGGRQYQEFYRIIVQYLEDQGHEILTHHLAEPDATTMDFNIAPADIFQRDMQWLQESDALIAEVSTPSHGVGYEIAIALNRKIPVLCCAQHDICISKILEGNSSKGYYFYRYVDQTDLIKHLANFLSSLKIG
jgi:hypothetical protein